MNSETSPFALGHTQKWAQLRYDEQHVLTILYLLEAFAWKRKRDGRDFGLGSTTLMKRLAAQDVRHSDIQLRDLMERLFQKGLVIKTPAFVKERIHYLWYITEKGAELKRASFFTQ